MSNYAAVLPPLWRTFPRVPNSKVPSQWQYWLLDRGSLTQRLISLAEYSFAVKVKGEYWAVPDVSERKALGLKSRQRVYIREVELWGQGQCWVKARTLIPRSTLRGSLLPLKHLGNKPLGARLFSDPKITRGAIEIALLQQSKTPVWARRSIFTLSNQSLLVTEIFMPALLSVN